MSIGWGIISTGNHPDIKILPAMRRAENTDVVAVYSRDIKRAEAFAKKHDIPRTYDSMNGLLNDSGVDAVFITSPNFLHAQHTRAAAMAGRHILIEKPMAVTIKEALDMVRISRVNGVKLGVGFHLRHHPGHRKARELIRQGALGVISMAQGQWCFGQRKMVSPGPKSGSSAWWNDPDMMGGASTLMGTGVHVVDLLYFLTGRRIVEVAAITDGQTDECPLEQVAAIAVRFSDGTIGTICAGRRMPDSENDIMIYGSHGRIALRDTLWEAFCGEIEVVSETVNISESYKHDLLALYRNEIEAFNRAIVNNEIFHASGEDGLHSVQVIRGIIESASSGRTVKIETVDI